MLKELEQIDIKMIQTIFEYNKMGREELKKEARAVLQEHRNGYIEVAS